MPYNYIMYKSVFKIAETPETGDFSADFFSFKIILLKMKNLESETGRSNFSDKF